MEMGKFSLILILGIIPLAAHLYQDKERTGEKKVDDCADNREPEDGADVVEEMLVVEAVGRLEDDGREKVQEEEVGGELRKDEVAFIYTIHVEGASVTSGEDDEEEGAEESAEDDEETGLGNLGRQDEIESSLFPLANISDFGFHF
jgi:hypothetical protein